MTIGALLLALAALNAQDDKAAEEALEAFKTAYNSTSEADRATAVIELGKIHHAKTLARLAGLLSTDGPTVRIAAAKAIGGFAELKKPAAAALAAGVPPNAKETTIETAIYDAMGRLEEPSALATLHRAFEDKETPVVKAAVQATGQIGNAGSIDPLIALLAKLEKIQKGGGGGSVGYTTPAGSSVTVRGEDPTKRAQDLIPAINKALNEITRESNGSSETWGAWWAKNKATFKSFK